MSDQQTRRNCSKQPQLNRTSLPQLNRTSLRIHALTSLSTLECEALPLAVDCEGRCSDRVLRVKLSLLTLTKVLGWFPAGKVVFEGANKQRLSPICCRNLQEALVQLGCSGEERAVVTIQSEYLCWWIALDPEINHLRCEQ